MYENVRLVGDAEVLMTTLDHAVGERGLDAVDVVKIDVEGAEFAVVSGAHAILRTFRPVLMMELQQNSLVAQGSGSREVVDVLSGFDYDVYCYADRGQRHLLRRFEDGEADVAQNVVAVPLEKQAPVVRL